MCADLLKPFRREAKCVGNSVNCCSVLHEYRGAVEEGENKMKHFVFQHFPPRTVLLNSVDFWKHLSEGIISTTKKFFKSFTLNLTVQ